MVRSKIFWNEQEAYAWQREHVPATGIVLEGHNGTQPYWEVIW